MPGKSIKRICRYCKEEFYVYPSDITRGSGIFCKKECMYESRKVYNSTCIVCGNKFYTRPNMKMLGYGKFCSGECRSVHNTNPVDSIIFDLPEYDDYVEDKYTESYDVLELLKNEGNTA